MMVICASLGNSLDTGQFSDAFNWLLVSECLRAHVWYITPEMFV